MSLEFQKQIKNNAQQIKDYMSELYSWEQEVALKEKTKSKFRKQATVHEREQRQRQQQIRKQKQTEQQNKQQESKPTTKPELKRDANTVQDYYKAWNSYDVDNELQRLEQEEKKAYQPYNPYQNTKSNIRAKPKAQMNIKGGRKVIKDPTSLKDKGNVYYKACDFSKALQYYSQCIQKLSEEENPNIQTIKLKALVLSNRAITYLKLNERAKALEDCNQSIRSDPAYPKSYLRRADCFRKLGKHRQALTDYRTIKQLTPEDLTIDKQISVLEKFMEKRQKEAQEALILKEFPQVIPDSQRIQIQEVEELDYEIVAEHSANYLDEL